MRFFYVRFVYVSFKGARTAFPPPPPNGPIPGGEVKKLQKNIRLAGTIKAICMPTDHPLLHTLVCVLLFMDAAGAPVMAQTSL
jgi:hypothetical protein